jgi:hypothetical protein
MDLHAVVVRGFLGLSADRVDPLETAGSQGREVRDALRSLLRVEQGDHATGRRLDPRVPARGIVRRRRELVGIGRRRRDGRAARGLRSRVPARRDDECDQEQAECTHAHHLDGVHEW